MPIKKKQHLKRKINQKRRKTSLPSSLFSDMKIDEDPYSRLRLMLEEISWPAVYIYKFIGVESDINKIKYLFKSGEVSGVQVGALTQEQLGEFIDTEI